MQQPFLLLLSFYSFILKIYWQKSKTFPCNFVSFISLWLAGQIFLPCKYKNTLTWCSASSCRNSELKLGLSDEHKDVGYWQLCAFICIVHTMWSWKNTEWWSVVKSLNHLMMCLLQFFFLMKMLNLKPLFLLLCFRCCSSSDPSSRPGDFFRWSSQQQHSGTDSATSGWNPHFLQGKPKFMDNI